MYSKGRAVNAFHNHAPSHRRKGRAVSYTPMGNQPKRKSFEPGEKGDAKWVEAVDKWRRKKSVTNKARYKNKKQGHKVNMAQVLDGRRSVISSPVVIKKYRKRKKKRKRRELLTQGDTEDEDSWEASDSSDDSDDMSNIDDGGVRGSYGPMMSDGLRGATQELSEEEAPSPENSRRRTIAGDRCVSQPYCPPQSTRVERSARSHDPSSLTPRHSQYMYITCILTRRDVCVAREQSEGGGLAATSESIPAYQNGCVCQCCFQL